MKKYLLPLAVASTLALQACNQQTPAPGSTTAPQQSEEAVLETHEQRLSYAVAVGFGRQMQANGLALDVPPPLPLAWKMPSPASPPA